MVSPRHMSLVSSLPRCPYCGVGTVVRNGKRAGKQRFHCRSCSRSFTEGTDADGRGLRAVNQDKFMSAMRDCYISGDDVGTVAARYNVSVSTIYNWLRRAEASSS